MPAFRAAPLCLLAAILSAAPFPSPAQSPPASGRVPWTSSHFHGSPDPPPPCRLEDAFPALKFLAPTVIGRFPGADRLLVAENAGKILTFRDEPGAKNPELFLELPGVIHIYGVAFHPRFRENRLCYVCYVAREPEPEGTRVSSFEVAREDPPRALRASEKAIITWLSGGHNGGCLEFGPDGFLYLSTGDGTAPSPPDALHTGQDLSDLLSSILRIDVDRAEGARAYVVPPDNPFVGLQGARPEIWAYGLRNPWKMTFDPADGTLWVGDVGWEMWELVQRVEKGGNYGWSATEGRQEVFAGGPRGPTPILPPAVEHPHSEAASVTGGIVYRGQKFPELRGAYLYGDYATGRIWGLRHNGKHATWHRELARSTVKIVAFGEDREGEILVLDHDGTGKIYRLLPSPPPPTGAEEFPRLLSRTGLFESTADQRPAPGVIPYSLNAELWMDGALQERLLAVPGDARIEVVGPLEWRFPEGTVLAKTISVETALGARPDRRRIETQVLHLERGTWQPYVYLWDDAGKEATLLDGPGKHRLITRRDPHFPTREGKFLWETPGRAACSACHNPWAGSVLGVNTHGLNRIADWSGFPPDSPENQLRRLERLGYFASRLPESLESLPRFPDLRDPAATPEAWARAYLHVNCSHCHRFGGGSTATIELFSTAELQKALIRARPLQGAFGIAGGSLLEPGDPFSSILLYRMAKTGGGHMPRLGARTVDERAVEMIEGWIRGLAGAAAPSASKKDDPSAGQGAGREEREKLIRSLGDPRTANEPALRAALASTRGALVLSRCVAEGLLPPALRGALLEEAARSTRGEVRDLFERFFPGADARERLGEVIEPAAILSQKGDAARGLRLYRESPAAGCRTCHALPGEALAGGKSRVGPDLAKIGGKYDRATLLRHILEPSLEVAPENAAYLLQTRGGEALLGLLVEKNEREVSLRDAQGELRKIPAGEVRILEKQSRSLMPDLLLQDLTAQEAADLLEYLTTLR